MLGKEKIFAGADINRPRKIPVRRGIPLPVSLREGRCFPGAPAYRSIFQKATL